MFNEISNHGIISDRRCHCKGHRGNDLQMMNTGSVTNYGIMTTRRCNGELNPQTLKIKTFINRGTLVLHKCHCNSQLLQIIDLINYGIVVNCLSYCKLVKEEAPKPIGAPENMVKIGSTSPSNSK
ncbi:uncharacterized protein LOC128261039 isoform X2 [Drosophila gunungcola]|uniref:uncharacterized protein LOC128261039 isoform X2 n=1 Tax=Drosophila gunungcola TaxID=103775 RepID=UPI0022E396E6|nr:uncharacterized protein LOC128261039 isoform X2 [Drosophila gunungcola]